VALGRALPHAHASAPARRGPTALLAAGQMRASVRAEAGGRVTSLWREAPDRTRTDILVPVDDAPFEPLFWPKGGCYPLAPWSNRIRGAAFPHAGRRIELDPHPSTLPHALHGFSHTAAWRVEEAFEDGLGIRLRHDPEAGVNRWPWAFEAVQRIDLDENGLTIEISVTNLAAEPMPVGLGVHPYFAVSAGDRIRLSRGAVWEADADGCATKLHRVAGRALDLVHGPDATTTYIAEWDGRAIIERADGISIHLEACSPLDHLVFHVPDGGAYCCLEPVSHVTDAFNLAANGVGGTGCRSLPAGERIAATVRMSVI
jgi:aldose 1-epimerase